ncbi:GNAT family protein [Actinoplanes sp. NPDC049596]|uniref:GNAT family N-acetyltransferase n=1 Tax=unclassified Actinoplanes TaxID=2626549 RepID=UPI00341D2551
MPIRPLYAYAAAHNAGSIRVLEKCGFRRDRTLETPEPGDGVEELAFVLAGGGQYATCGEPGTERTG